VKHLAIIKTCEGLRLAKYLCPAGVWTIGYGHTGHIPKSPIIKSEAEILLAIDLASVEKMMSRYVRLELNINQKGALISLIFNIGIGNFRASTLRMKLNRGDLAGAADEFPKWRKGGGKVLPGLVKRREMERALFLTPVEPPPVTTPPRQSHPSFLSRLCSMFVRG
jgi:lysozyme